MAPPPTVAHPLTEGGARHQVAKGESPMIHRTWSLLALALILAVGIAITGCGSSPTPTRPAPTQPPQPPQVITVIITPTALPPTATVALPTITPIPTIAVATVPPAPTTAAVKPTAVPAATKAGPTATRRPTTPAAPVAVATNTVVAANKYPAPVPVRPIYNQATGQTDERHYPADTLQFIWQSVGSLQGDECYQIRVEMVPGQGDTFLQCDPSATQVGAGSNASFTLNKPNQAGPNYSALWPLNAGECNVNWTVQVVKDNGKGTGAQDPTGQRHSTTPLSPKSTTVFFLLKGG